MMPNWIMEIQAHNIMMTIVRILGGNSRDYGPAWRLREVCFSTIEDHSVVQASFNRFTCLFISRYQRLRRLRRGYRA